MNRIPWMLLFVLYFALPNTAQAQYVGCKFIQQVPRDECEALEAFFYQAGGEEWFNNANWLQYNQPCSWFGVTCAATAWPRSITHIEMVDNNVGGILPEDLSALVELRIFVVDNQNETIHTQKRLSGTIPLGLAQLEKLEILRLSNHALEGSIPFEFEQFKKLKVLDLSKNKLANSIPQQLSNLTELERLNLSRNNLIGNIHPDLGKLSKLQDLNLSNNTLWGPIPASFGQLQSLVNLDLSSNILSGPIPLSFRNLELLNRFSVDDNDLSGILPPSVVHQFSDLFACSLTKNNTSLCIQDLDALAGLQSNTLCGLPIQAECSACAEQSTLSEGSCEALEDFYVESSGQTWINQTGWLYDPEPCDWVGVSCQNGEVISIDLPQNGITGSLSVSLTAIPTIEQVDLSGNELTGSLPVSFDAFTHLERLILDDNFLSGSLPLNLTAWANALDQCSIAGANNSLCMPDTPTNAALAPNGVCGLMLDASCSVFSFSEWRNVEAIADQNEVVLSWTLNQVQSTSQVLIEWKQKGSFVTIDSVEINPGETLYTFRVPVRDEGVKIFRLRQVDKGMERISEEVEVLVTQSDVFVEPPFPNPFTDQVRLRFGSNTPQRWEIVLYDGLGRKVRTVLNKELSGREIQEFVIDAQGLSAGQYYLQFMNKSGAQKTVSLVLVK